MMEKTKKKIISISVTVIAIMLCAFFTVFATELFGTQEDDYWRVIQYDEIKDYRNNPETIEGYVFAGWFAEESCAKETALSSSVKEGPAYAKYVPEEILGLKAQVNGELWNDDLQDDGDKKGAIRFVTSVDSLDYAQVGFVINIGKGDTTKASKTVYEKLYAKVGGHKAGDQKSEEFKPNEIFHASSVYFKTWTVTSVPELNYLTEFTVTPFWKTLDGTIVKGTQGIKTVNQGRSWEYVVVDDTGSDSTTVDENGKIGLGTYNYPYKTLDYALAQMEKYQHDEDILKDSSVETHASKTVYVRDALLVASGSKWNKHNLDVTITGDDKVEGEGYATVDFSALTSISLGDSVTFEKMNLICPLPNGTTPRAIYANGHRLQISADVTTTNSAKIFGGGSDGATVESTHVTVLGGQFAEIYAGGNGSTVTGDTYLYVGAKVDGSSMNVYGGGYNETVKGDTHVTIDEEAIINYVYGGGNGSSQVVNGTCYVTIEDNAEIKTHVFGGGRNGSTNNTCVNVGGEVKASRVHGGSRNGTVDGDTHVTVAGKANITGYVFGGGDEANSVVNGTCYVTIKEQAKIDNNVFGGGNNGTTNNTYVVVEGGTIEGVFGGQGASGKAVNNTNVYILGGKITRRVYGGNYNNYEGEWKGTNSVNGYSSVVIGPKADISNRTGTDTSVVAISRIGSLAETEVGVMIVHDGANGSIGWSNMYYIISSIPHPQDYTHFSVNVRNGGTVTSESGFLRITPDEATPYATVKDGDTVLFQCQGEGTYSLRGLVTPKTLTVEFTDTISGTLEGDFELSYRDSSGNENGKSCFSSLEAAVASVSTPNIGGAGTQKTAIITINGEEVTVDEPIALTNNQNIVLRNGVDGVIIKRTAVVNMFDVAAGCTLTIDGNITVDGGKDDNVQGPSMIKNAGTFVLEKGAILQKAATGGTTDEEAYRGAALYNTGSAEIKGTVTGNSAYVGGAIYNTGIATLNGAMTENEASYRGGVVYNDKGTATFEAGTYSDNFAQNNGGVIYSAGGAVVNIKAGQFSNNEAEKATGGVAAGNANINITGGTFTGNIAENGAAVLNVATSYEAKISNATITNNVPEIASSSGSPYNGAIYVSGGGSLTLENCDIHDNGLNLKQDSPGSDISLGNNIILNVKNNKNVGVIFKYAQDTKATQFCISGENFGEMILIPHKNDYAGNPNPNPVLITFPAEMSADKKANIVEKIIVRKYTSKTQYADDQYWIDTEGKLQDCFAAIGETKYPTLKAAVEAAQDRDVIYVLSNTKVVEPIEIGSAENPKNITITNVAGKNVTITRATTDNMFKVTAKSTLTLGTAGSTKKLTIEGNGQAGSSLINNAGTFETKENVTIQNANAGTTSGKVGGVLYNTGRSTLNGTMTGNKAYQGGVVYNSEGTVTLNGTMTANNASYQGGVAYNYRGTVTFEDGTYSENSAKTNGGIIYSDSKSTTEYASLYIKGGKFTNNVASDATGGVAGGKTNTYITGGTFTGNKANNGASVLNVANGYEASILKATITGNEVPGGTTIYNGAIYVSQNGKLTLEKCTIRDNDGYYHDEYNPGCDIGLGSAAKSTERGVDLIIKDNTDVGVIYRRETAGTKTRITITEEYKGKMVLIPYTSENSPNYEAGTTLVTFEGLSTSEIRKTVENIVVRDYISEDEWEDPETPEWTDDVYCVDTDGLLQYKNAEAKVGTKTYLTLADAVEDAASDSTVYVLKDIEVAETIAIGSAEESKELTITSMEEKDVTITRTDSVNMFNVVAGCTLTIDGTVTLEGNKEAGVTGASLINNAGTFVTGENVTIKNASAGSGNGGVLYNTGTVTLNGTMTGNEAVTGAIVYNEVGTVTIESGEYRNNVARDNGGVVFSALNANAKNVNIEGGLFEANAAENKTGGVLGGNADTSITGGTFRGNRAQNGASVLNVASNYEAFISNAIIEENVTEVEGTPSKVYNGAIFVSAGGDLTLEECNIKNNGYYYDEENPGCDISLGSNIDLYIRDNTNVGVIFRLDTGNSSSARIHITKEYTGEMVLIPYKNDYTTGNALVTFEGITDAALENTLENIVVRDYISEDEWEDPLIPEWTDDLYCVDTAGLLQYKNAEAKIENKTYETLASAVSAAKTGDIVYVLKDISVGSKMTIGNAETAKDITVTNIPGKDVTITRASGLTDSMFNVTAGSKLTLGTAGSAEKLTIDGAGVVGKSLINNAGEFETQDNVTIKNANAGTEDNANCFGGVLTNAGEATLNGSTMTGNRAGRGAVVYNIGTVTINGGTYSGNTATLGGTVIYSNDKTNAYVNIEGGTFKDNVAQGKTGGVASGNNKITTIKKATFQNNTAKDGASVLNVAGGSEAFVSDVIITGNNLVKGNDNYNGALYVSTSGKLTLEKCDIHDNDGLFVNLSNPGCDVGLGTSAVLNIKNNTNLGIVHKKVASASVNILEEYTGKMILLPAGDKYDIDSTMVIFAESMSADKIDNTVDNIVVRNYVTSKEDYNDDQYWVATDGTLQTIQSKPAAKVGNNRFDTLNEAVNTAEDGSTVYVLKSIEVPETITIGSADAPKNITIKNIANKEVMITRTAAVNMFNVPKGSTLTIDGTITLEGNKEAGVTGASLINNAGTFVTNEDVTIQNASAGTASGKVGGVLYNTGEATLNGTMTGNVAYQGAVVYNKKKLTIQGGTYSNNTAKLGAGVIRCDDGTNATVKIEAGLFKDNVAEGATGGVISGNAKTIEITGGTFSENTAAGGGTVINVAGVCTATISNATMTQNTAVSAKDNYNGTIYISGGGSLTLKNCTIVDNVGVASSQHNPASDVRVGGGATLNIENNVNVGVVAKAASSAKINILEEYTGVMILIPFSSTEVSYQPGSTMLVTFAAGMSAEAKENTVAHIVVRKYTSKTAFTTDVFCVDTDGKLQNKPATE